MKPVKHYTELIEQAKNAEENSELQKAAVLYQQAIRQEPLEEFPYNRLMIIYRKFKQPKDEHKVIAKALEVFKNHYDRKTEPYTGKDKLGQVSRALLKSLSGNEKKLSYTTYPEPIPKWTIRKKTLEKKIAKAGD